MTTDATEMCMVEIDRIRVLPGHNARGEIGDVSELADSIRTHGLSDGGPPASQAGAASAPGSWRPSIS
jgi:hypothetical protein